MRVLMSDYGFSNRTMRTVDRNVLRGKSTVGRSEEGAPTYIYKESKRKSGFMRTSTLDGAPSWGTIMGSIRGVPGIAGVSSLPTPTSSNLKSSGYSIIQNAPICM